MSPEPTSSHPAPKGVDTAGSFFFAFLFLTAGGLASGYSPLFGFGAVGMIIGLLFGAAIAFVGDKKTAPLIGSADSSPSASGSH